MTETWKEIPNYKGLYQASNFGRIKRIKPYTNTPKDQIIKPAKNIFGYLQLALSKNNKQKTHIVHSLITRSFLGLKPQGLTVNHRDGDKLNNHIENLEYVTRQENERHAQWYGLKASGSRHGRRNGHYNRLSKEERQSVYQEHQLGLSYTALVKKYNISLSTVHRILRG